MKIGLLFVVVLCCSQAFSQTVNSINKLIYRVDHTVFTDSIDILDTTTALTKPVRIIAYLSDGTLQKSIARFRNSSRIRLTYYSTRTGSDAEAVYVKEIDEHSGEQLTEVYGFDFTVLRSAIAKPLESEERERPYELLQNADYSTTIGFALVDRKAEKYHFKVKLVQALPLPPSCGLVAFALLQKFEVISTDCPNYDNRYVLIIEPCPEFLGAKFFEDNAIYEVDVATNSGVTFGYSYYNNYEKENLAVFWSRNIIKKN